MNQKDFKNLQSTWDKLGNIDPLWAILSEPSKENGGWEIDDFFQTGQDFLKILQNHLLEVDHAVTYGRCLDFGCGIGRISRALSSLFNEVHGVDVAPSMINEAKKQHQDYDNITFHVNKKNDLTLFPDAYFDFILSIIVLQHIPPAITRNYIKEFVRILKPGGLIVFQLPSNPRQSKKDLAFSARITCDTEPRHFPGGSKQHIVAVVENTSRKTWEACKTGRNPFRLGNHWYDSSGHMVIRDDGRCDIPELNPGESCELTLEINTPSWPGKYWLGLDAVQEHVAWFEEAGSKPVKIPVTVTGDSEPGAPSSPSPAPAAGGEKPAVLPAQQKKPPLPIRVMKRLKGRFSGMMKTQKPQYEMNGIKQGDVLEILATAGAKTIKVTDDYSAGFEWESYLYFVSK